MHTNPYLCTHTQVDTHTHRHRNRDTSRHKYTHKYRDRKTHKKTDIYPQTAQTHVQIYTECIYTHTDTETNELLLSSYEPL